VISRAEIVRLIAHTSPVILDIGCNDGEHSRMFVELFESPEVYSFDPEPRARARFKEPGAVFFPLALGSRDGEVAFYQSGGCAPGESVPRDLSGSTHRPTGHLQMHPWCTFDSVIVVQERRLDSWARSFLKKEQAVDFVWADVQGAEADLIEGGRETLARTRFFYTEYSNVELYAGQPSLVQLQEMLPDFETVEVFPYDVLFKNKRLS
jgi:2-O-methyltransferase